MRITLIGFMGTGKSTISRFLGEALGLSVVELDAISLTLSGRATISEIFTTEGEDRFREYETEALQSLALKDQLVLSTGGGVVMRPQNLEYIRRPGGVVVYLEAEFSEILRRIKGKKGRPLFEEQDKAQALFDLRRPFYEAWCDFRVSADSRPASEAVAEIIARLG